MRVAVHGQVRGGPVMSRDVTLREFIVEWGPFARFLWQNARGKWVAINDYAVQIVVLA